MRESQIIRIGAMTAFVALACGAAHAGGDAKFFERRWNERLGQLHGQLGGLRVPLEVVSPHFLVAARGAGTAALRQLRGFGVSGEERLQAENGSATQRDIVVGGKRLIDVNVTDQARQFGLPVALRATLDGEGRPIQVFARLGWPDTRGQYHKMAVYERMATRIGELWLVSDELGELRSDRGAHHWVQLSGDEVRRWALPQIRTQDSGMTLLDQKLPGLLHGAGGDAGALELLGLRIRPTDLDALGEPRVASYRELLQADLRQWREAPD